MKKTIEKKEESIKVSYKTWKILNLIKLREELSSADEVINYLIRLYRK